MTREEAISEWTFRSNHIKKWLDEYGEEPSIRHYVELIDMAIKALSEGNIARDIATILENEQDMRVILQNAESVEVVRCKDCKWHKLTDNNETEVCTNKQWDISMAVYPIISADDFCSYGERKEK